MKNKKHIILLITLLSILVVILTVFMVHMINGNFKLMKFSLFHKVSNELVFDEVYDNAFSKIKIKADTSDIYIKESTTDEVRVTIYGDKDNTWVEVNNSDLVIESKDKGCFGFCFNMKIAKIEVSIPSDSEGMIDVENAYGDVTIDEFLNRNITVDEDCGDVTILGGNRVEINNDYGDIVLKQADIANIKASAGDIEIETINEITVENNYGDIKINQVNHYMNVSEDCGDVEIDSINLQKDSYIKNDFGDIKVGTTNEIYIHASTDLGSVKINNNYPKADVTLKIENDCGDIKVNN